MKLGKKDAPIKVLRFRSQQKMNRWKEVTETTNLSSSSRRISTVWRMRTAFYILDYWRKQIKNSKSQTFG